MIKGRDMTADMHSSFQTTALGFLSRLRARDIFLCMKAMMLGMQVFRPVLHFTHKFSMEDLESALLVPNDLLGDVHIGLLKAIPPSIKNPINRETWIASLGRKLKERWHAVTEGPFPLVPQHGDEITSYKHLSPDVRVAILKALCEARLDQEDMRTFISERAKQETSLVSIRKEMTGTDMEGATYWYESDSVAGYRLYRELQRDHGKDKVKVRGHLVSAPAVGNWETLATTLDEFESVAERLCSSRNKKEVLLGNKIKSDIVPDLVNAEKRKQRMLKKQLREASLLDNLVNVESGAGGRTRRQHKPVSYTYDDYDTSINEAINVMNCTNLGLGESDTSSSSECSSIDEKAAYSDEHLHKRQRAGSLDGSDLQSDESEDGCLHKRQRAGALDGSDIQSNESKDINAATNVCDCKEEFGATEMNSKVAVVSGKEGLQATKKPQDRLTRSTRSKTDEKVEGTGGPDGGGEDEDKLRNRKQLDNAGLGNKTCTYQDVFLTDIHPTSNGVKNEPLDTCKPG